MTKAWLQRFITLGSLMMAGLLAAWLWDEQRGWAIFCLAMPLLLTSLILGIQFVWAAQINQNDPSPPASAGQWLKAWLTEWRLVILVFCWWQPFRQHAIADRLQPTPGRRGMVLVHGFFCNRALWTHWMTYLAAKERVFVAVDLEPEYGSISNYVQIVEHAVRQVEQATGLPPVIVGHSMGGLAIRVWAAQLLSSSGMHRVHRIITLGTPHHGTAMAAGSHTENGREMRQGSRWLQDNASHLPDNFAQLCTCYYSNCDNIVFPASSGALVGADNQHVAGFAHMQLAFSPEIQQACLSLLET